MGRHVGDPRNSLEMDMPRHVGEPRNSFEMVSNRRYKGYPGGV